MIWTWRRIYFSFYVNVNALTRRCSDKTLFNTNRKITSGGQTFCWERGDPLSKRCSPACRVMHYAKFPGPEIIGLSKTNNRRYIFCSIITSQLKGTPIKCPVQKGRIERSSLLLFNSFYGLEIQSAMLVFSTPLVNLRPSILLTGSPMWPYPPPLPSVNKYGGGGGGLLLIKCVTRGGGGGGGSESGASDR